MRTILLAVFAFDGLLGTCQSYIELTDPGYGVAWKCVPSNHDPLCYINRATSNGPLYTAFRPLSSARQKEVVYEAPGWHESREYCTKGNTVFEVGVRWGDTDTVVYFAELENDTVHHILSTVPYISDTHFLWSFTKLLEVNDTLVAVGTAALNEQLNAGGYEDLQVLFYDPVTDSIYIRMFTDTLTIVYAREMVWNPHRNRYALWFQGQETFGGRFLGFYELDRQFNVTDTFFLDSIWQPDDSTRSRGIDYFPWVPTVLSGNYIHQLVYIENFNFTPPYTDPTFWEYMVLIFNAQTMEIENQLAFSTDSGDTYGGTEGFALWENGTYVAGIVRDTLLGQGNSAVRVTKILDNGTAIWQRDYIPDVPKNYFVFGIYYDEEDSTIIVYGTVVDDEQTSGNNPFFFMIDPDGNVLAEHSVSIQRDIALYPNPADDFITLKSEKTVDEITMADLHGRVIMKRLRPSSTIDVRDLPAGVYLLHIRVGENVQCRKVVIR